MSMALKLVNAPAAARQRRGVAQGDLRVAIVAHNCSVAMGGEATIPYHYFRLLRARGIDAFLVGHQRNQQEIESLLPLERSRMYWAADTFVDRLLYSIGQILSPRVNRIAFGFLSRLYEQRVERKLVRQLVREENVNVVHQPVPVSPVEPSLMHGLGVPVVIGPMNGGMSFPPAFRDRESWVGHAAIRFGRSCGRIANIIWPGKRKAKVLLVANERTRHTLEQCVPVTAIELPENGVDLKLWDRNGHLIEAPASSSQQQPVRFVFMGRLVDWKSVDLLLQAFRVVAASNQPAELHIVGDGPEREPLQQLAKELGLGRQVYFHGWLTQPECAAFLARCDALVLPSLIECGAAVVLEAMAASLPVIATSWGGPADYLDPTCGILVPPVSRDGFIQGLAEAMLKLTGSASLRKQMGQAGRRKVAQCFSWEGKVDQMVDHYLRALSSEGASDAPDMKLARVAIL